jgi:hypothetical protein
MAGSGGVIIVIIIFFLIVVGGGAGLWYSNALCDYGVGKDCPSPSPGPSGTPSGTPSGAPGRAPGPSGVPGPSGAPGRAPGPAPSGPPACLTGQYRNSSGACTPCSTNVPTGKYVSALCSASGRFAAWRRSPVYSTGRNSRWV